MLVDHQTVRYYQKVTDAIVDLYNQGYSFDEVRLYLDGFIACLRQTNCLEPYLVNRLEDECLRFLRDPSNFELPQLETQTETDY